MRCKRDKTMDEAILKLTPKEVTIVLQALSELPYKDSASIIRKIVEQTAGQ
jgi:hypothetical protein